MPDAPHLHVPVARRDPESGFTAHGRWFDDPYAWMENLESPETRAWMEGQEAATRAILDAVPGRDWFRERLIAAHRFERSSPVTRAGGREFWWHTSPDAEKPRLMVRRADGEPTALIDPNTWPAADTLVFAVPSGDGKFVAFGRASGSTHDATTSALDVATGRLLPDRPRGTSHSSLAWLPDSSGFLYSACPEPGEVPPGEEALWNAIYLHSVGSASPAQRIFGDDVEKDYWCSVSVSECGRFAVLSKWDFVHANESWLLRLDDGALIPVATGMDGLTTAQVIGEQLLIWTDRGAPKGRACIAPLANPTNWNTILPEGDDTLQAVAGVGGRVYAVYSREASAHVQVHDIQGRHLRDVTLPAIGSVNQNTGDGVECGVSGSWGGSEVTIAFESYVQPRSHYRYNFETGRLEAASVPDAGIDASRFETKRVWYSSKDGTRVSMFLVHRKGLERDGRWSVRLTAYGGFNISLEPRFNPVNAAWLQAGGVLAFAHVRGGGEYGREWHHAAIKTRRQNAYDDFIAAARWLVAAGYTTADRLVVRGNSNGGILAGVTMLQAPGAFGGVFCRAATLDMLQFPKFSHLAASTVEFGSPDDPVEGPYIAAYSPYHNVVPGTAYPLAVFVAALNDRNSPPYDPLKMVARLQAEAGAGGPYLFLPLRSSGHGGATTLSALIEQDLDELAFYSWSSKLMPSNS